MGQSYLQVAGESTQKLAWGLGGRGRKGKSGETDIPRDSLKKHMETCKCFLKYGKYGCTHT